MNALPQALLILFTAALLLAAPGANAQPAPEPMPAARVVIVEPLHFQISLSELRRRGRAPASKRPAAAGMRYEAPAARGSPSAPPAIMGSAADRLYLRAVALANRGDHRGARAALDALFARHPRYATGHILAGSLAQVEGDLVGARAHYEAYLEQAPRGRHARELQTVLSRLGAWPTRVASSR